MDIIPDIVATGLIYFFHLLAEIGPFFLFIALLLGIVGLPVPDEMLLLGAGYLTAHGKLLLLPTLIAAILGSICGITVSYLLGRLVGFVMIKKYASKLNITEQKIEMVQKWFDTIGKWILLVGYYLPVFRHLVGFVAGWTKMHYRTFAIFAYSGAILWSMTFFSLGFFFFDWFKGLFGK